MPFGIKDIQVYLPEKILTSKELVERFDFDPDFLEHKIGINSRHIAAKDESVSDMAVKASKSLFMENHSFTPDSVDLLVVCTQNPDFKIPHTAAIVQKQLSIPSIATFDVNLACSGFVYSLAVVASFMERHNMKNAVLITSDAYSKVIDNRDRDTMAIFGDGACAVWICSDCVCHPLLFSFGTNGEGYDKLIVKDGGSRNPLNYFLSNQPVPGEEVGSLYMNGREIFDFMLKEVPEDTVECIEKNGLTINTVDYFIFHQANKFMLDCLSKRMKIPEDKMVYNLKDIGNTVSSSIPMALKHLMDTSELSGKNVFISGFGAGLSWASTVLKFQEGEALCGHNE